MNPFFITAVAAVAVLIWAIGSYFFWRIERGAKAQRAKEGVSPAFLFADRFIAESQAKIQDLIERSEAPLSAAQNDLLELRLEASRLPQGVKSLSEVREALGLPLRPLSPPTGLAGAVGIYLEEGSFRKEGDSLVVLKTPLGEMPILEAGPGGPLADRLKTLLPRMNSPEAESGGFVYFQKQEDFQGCLGDPGLMEGLRARRMTPLDLKGLTALLSSLRLSRDVEGLVSVFEEGVRSTSALLGKSEGMGAALSTLSARAVKLRAVMDGASPDGLTK
jgi:hypothetical protein